MHDNALSDVYFIRLFRHEEDMKEIQVKNMTVLVDDQDYELVSKHNWCLQPNTSNPNYKKRYYAKARINGEDIYMHDLICPSELTIDHKDLNGLNNQRANLRECTRSQNSCYKPKDNNPKNTSRYKGVSNLGNGKYRAGIGGRKFPRVSKYFNDEIEAALWYNKKAKEYYGEFAYLNEIG